jgi:hypothetical protein
MLIEVGTYSGDGSSSRQIETIMQTPSVVIAKAESTQVAICKTGGMASNKSKFLTGTTGSVVTDAILELNEAGFTIGDNLAVNETDVLIRWLALKDDGDREMGIGSFTGNSTDNRTISDANMPDDPSDLAWLVIMCDDTQLAQQRSSVHSGDSTCGFATDESTDRIQQFLANGFQVGSHPTVNFTSRTMWYFWVKKRDGLCNVIGYTGNGSSQNVTGFGFDPNTWVQVKGIPINQAAQWKWASSPADESQGMTGGHIGSRITGFISDGISVGNLAAVNQSGAQYYAIGLQANSTPSSARRVSITL